MLCLALCPSAIALASALSSFFLAPAYTTSFQGTVGDVVGEGALITLGGTPEGDVFRYELADRCSKEIEANQDFMPRALSSYAEHWIDDPWHYEAPYTNDQGEHDTVASQFYWHCFKT